MPFFIYAVCRSVSIALSAGRGIAGVLVASALPSGALDGAALARLAG